MAEENNNKLLTQAQGFWSRLSTVQKALLIGIPTVIIVGIISLVFSMKPHDYGVLYSDLEVKDAAKIVESLKTANIDYELKDGGTTVLVDKSKLYDTRIKLAGEGLPESSVVGYELFDKTNLGMSEFVQKVNYRRALEGELSKTIGSLDEVQKVRVHIVIPDKALFKQDQKNPTASVTLHLKSGRSLSKINVEGIQNLIASSIEGMNPREVTVVDQRGNILSEVPPDPSTVAGLTAQQYDEQRKVEEYVSNKVQSLLDGVLGSDNAKVRVTAELDFTRIEQTKTDYDPDKQVIRSEQQIAESNKSTDSLSYPAVSMDKNQSNTISNYEIGQNVEHIIHSVGNVKRLSVAAMINGTQKINDSNGVRTTLYVPRTDEEMQKLTEIVKNAVGYDPSRNDQVSVINVPFDSNQIFDDGYQTNKPVWWKNPEYIKPLILIVAMLIVVFLMVRLLSSNPLKERVRIAMELPKKVQYDEELQEDFNEPDEELEHIDFGDSLLLLPAELPEQLLLESDREDEIETQSELPGESLETSLQSRQSGGLEGISVPELSEDAVLKIEIKNKVEEFIEFQTEEAVKMVRAFMTQDTEEKGARF